jgi:hypothetical protein
VLSSVLIWCEGTILLDGPPFNLNLSPLSYLYRYIGIGGGGFGTLLMLYVPLLYCAVCCYYAMFRLKICNTNALHPNQHSDGQSMLFNAT